MTTIQDHRTAIADARSAIDRAEAAGEDFNALLAQADAATAQAQTDRDTATTALTSIKTELIAALKRISELEPRPPVTRLPFGVGINEKAASKAFPMLFTAAQLEADAGVKFAYMREYFTLPATGVAQSAITWCETKLKVGRVPVISFKMPKGVAWLDVAAGKLDTVVDATIDALQALQAKYGRRIIVAIHHEPNNGDGKLADFKAMTSHLVPIVRRPGQVEYWICETGWAQLFDKTTDWTLGASYVEGIDGYAWDPYLSLGGSSSKLVDMRTAYLEKFAAWAESKGIQWGIWETGLNEDAAVSKLAGVTTWWVDFVAACAELGATMCIYWNNRVDAAHEDWRVSKTMPANKYQQVIDTMRRWPSLPVAA